jgi:hypothetical protein
LAALTAAAVPVPGDAGIAAATRDALAAASARLVSLVAENLSHPASAVPRMDMAMAAAILRGAVEAAAATGGALNTPLNTS